MQENKIAVKFNFKSVWNSNCAIDNLTAPYCTCLTSISWSHNQRVYVSYSLTAQISKHVMVLSVHCSAELQRLREVEALTVASQ